MHTMLSSQFFYHLPCTLAKGGGTMACAGRKATHNTNAQTNWKIPCSFFDCDFCWMYDSSFADLPTYSLPSNTYALVMRHVFTTSAVIHYQEPTQRHEKIEYLIHMFFEKVSHKKSSSIDVPTVFVTSILNQPYFVANQHTYNVIFCHIIQTHQNYIKSSL